MSLVFDIPIGTCLMYAGTVLPSGYLWCDGTIFSTTAYPDLYKVIHNYFSEVSVLNSIYFAVPDMRGRVACGVGDGFEYPLKKRNIVKIFNGNNIKSIGLAVYDGESTHKLSTNEVGDHVHYFKDWAQAEVYGNVSTNALGLVQERSAGSPSGADGDNLPFDAPSRVNSTLKVGGTYSPANENTSLQPLGLPHNNIQPYCSIKYIIRAL